MSEPQAQPTVTAPKPGFKTTEFWLTAVGSIAGLILAAGLEDSHILVKIAGLALTGLSILGYQVTRGSVKKAANLLLLAVTLSLAAGCAGTQKGYLKASNVDGGMRDVVSRHDRMVKGELDPKTLSAEDRATFLRTSTLILKALDEAKNK